jgi:hypothetical protein
MRRFLEDFLSLLLRHASQDSENLSFSGFPLELLQAAEDLLLGLIADAAGVIENQLGGFGRSHLAVSFGQKCANDLLRVVDIHLTPEGLDVEGFRGH